MFWSFINLGYFPSLLRIRIQKYICSMQLSLTPKENSLLHLQPIPRNVLTLLERNLHHCIAMYLSPYFPSPTVRWAPEGKGHVLPKPVFNSQSSSYLISWRLFLRFILSFLKHFLCSWDTTFSWFLFPYWQVSLHLLCSFSISFPTTIRWHTSGFSLSVPFSIYAHAPVDSI